MTELAPDAHMRALKSWAVERMIDGTGTPWAWFQFMKLVEVIDTFLEAGEDAGLTRPARTASAEPDIATAIAENVVVFNPALRSSL
jgi:hypothetical protein